MTNVHRAVLATVSESALVLSLSLFRAEGIGASPAEALAQAGGKALVESSGCFDCHRIGDRGSRVGPNLSDIGGRRKSEQLRQALVAPDDEILPENRSVRLVTREGDTMTGRLLNQDAVSVQMINSKEELKTYLRDGLREFTIVDKGLMPAAKLPETQIADIVGYLGSLK